MNNAVVDETFAEAFPMRATRIVVTAIDEDLVRIAAAEFCGNASSVIGCDAEAGVERFLAVANNRRSSRSFDFSFCI